jgi:hygromycin-B 7''-O-kinase
MLQAVLGERRIPAPQLVAIGEISAGMPYLVVKAVEGETAEDVWKHIPRDNQLSLASDLGTIVRAINEIPPQTLQAVEHRWGDRRAYAAAWREHMVRKIKMTITLPEHERNEFVRFLELEGRTLVEEGTTVTHRELAHNHVYLGLRDGRWSVTGVIDWADGMIGPAEWDTSFVWLWVFSRDRGAMEAFLETRYGPAGPPPLLGRRCLGVVLQTYEGPDLWEEIAGQLTGADEDPVHEFAAMLFTEGVFG